MTDAAAQSNGDRIRLEAGWKADTQDKQERTGVLIGSGIGGLNGIAETSLLLKEKGPRRVSPFFIPGRLINLAGGYVSIRHSLKGPNHAVVTACSTGAHAIGDASRLGIRCVDRESGGLPVGVRPISKGRIHAVVVLR